MDACCSAENRGFLFTYCLSVRYLELGGAIVTLLCGPSLSLVLSLSQSFELWHLLLCLNSGTCIFHRWLCPLASIGQRKCSKVLSTKGIKKITKLSFIKCKFLYSLILLSLSFFFTLKLCGCDFFVQCFRNNIHIMLLSWGTQERCNHIGRKSCKSHIFTINLTEHAEYFWPKATHTQHTFKHLISLKTKTCDRSHYKLLFN